MVEVWSLVAVIIAFLMLYRTYDEVVARFIYHIYTPDISISVHASAEQGGSTDEYKTGYMGGFAAGKYNIQRLDPDEAERILLVPVSVQSLEDKDVRLSLEITTEPIMSIWFEEMRAEGDYFDFIAHDEGQKQRYEIEEKLYRFPYGSYPLVYLAVPIHAENAYERIPVDTRVRVSIEASEFKLPVLEWSLPRSIGVIHFEPIEHHFDILGPHHEGVDGFKVVEEE